MTIDIADSPTDGCIVRSFATVLSLLLGATCHAAGPSPVTHEWTVRAGGRDVVLECEGRVTAETEDFVPCMAPSGDLLITWRAEKGERVKRGQPLHIYSCSNKQRQIPVMKMSLQEAEREYEKKELMVAKEFQTLLREKTKLEAELDVAEATLKALRSVDSMNVELLKREVRRAEQTVQAKETVHEDKQELYRLGQVSQRDVAKALLALRQSELAASSARVQWQLAAREIDLPAAWLEEIHIQELKSKLGGDNLASEDGMGARIEALGGKIARQRKQFEAQRDKAERAYQEAVCDAFDHVPVNSIEICVGGVTSRVNFLPAGATAVPGWQTDTGAVFATDRGYGWDRDRSSFMVDREGVGTTSGTAVVRGEAVWRYHTGPGKVALTLGVGDTKDWDGSLIRINGTVAFVVNKLKENVYTNVIWHGTVDGDELVLQFGGPHPKTMRAEYDGALTDTPWSPRQGHKTRHWVDTWPVLYLTRPEKYYVKARVPRQYAGLFKPVAAGPVGRQTNAAAGNEEGEKTVEVLRRELATDTVEIIQADGRVLPATVDKVGGTPVRLSFAPVAFWFLWGDAEDPKDQIARELLVKLTPEHAICLEMDSHVTVRASLTLADDVAWIPAHYVRQDDGEFSVLPAGDDAPQRVQGFRAGDIFVISSGLKAGMVLALPGRTNDDGANLAVFDGHVIPGRQQAVIIPKNMWGIIKDLRPEGEWVEENEWVMTLGNPWQEKQKKEDEEERRLAREKFLQAAEERRLKAIAANQDHHARLLAERLARAKVRALREVDPLKRVQVENAYQITLLAYRDASDVVSVLEREGIASVNELDMYRHKQALAKVAMDRKHLAMVQALRLQSWLTQAETMAAWEAARKELDVREKNLLLARQEEQVARLKSKLELEATLSGGKWRRMYEKRRVIRSPTSGRLFYEQGYDFVKRCAQKFSKEMEAWEGLTVARILDMNDLAFETELPETYYHRLDKGSKAFVVFPHLDRLTLPARVQEIGRAFYVPKEMKQAGAGEQSISSRKVFKAVFAFSPPKDVQDRLTLGTKGQVVLE